MEAKANHFATTLQDSSMPHTVDARLRPSSVDGTGDNRPSYEISYPEERNGSDYFDARFDTLNYKWCLDHTISNVAVDRRAVARTVGRLVTLPS
jgi:hypothetical protein